MPVAAVIFGGRPMVSAGSSMTIEGCTFGWKISFFWCVSSLVMTETRPTSEPVPDVVGTAMIGATPAGSTRSQLSPTSSKSQIGRFCPAISAMALPASSALPPPKAIDAVMLAGAVDLRARPRHSCRWDCS